MDTSIRRVDTVYPLEWTRPKKGDLNPCLCVVVTSRYLASDSLSEIIKGMNVGTSVRGAVPVDTKNQQFEFRSSM